MFHAVTVLLWNSVYSRYFYSHYESGAARKAWIRWRISKIDAKERRAWWAGACASLWKLHLRRERRYGWLGNILHRESVRFTSKYYQETLIEIRYWFATYRFVIWCPLKSFPQEALTIQIICQYLIISISHAFRWMRKLLQLVNLVF